MFLIARQEVIITVGIGGGKSRACERFASCGCANWYCRFAFPEMVKPTWLANWAIGQAVIELLLGNLSQTPPVKEESEENERAARFFGLHPSLFGCCNLHCGAEK